MTASYRWVQWNRHKIVYDAVLASAILTYIALYVAAGLWAFAPPGDISVPILVIRATSTLALILLHVILVIGPLARISDLFAPLLYNRRHLGVAFFAVASVHALLATLFYGGFGQRNPVSAVVAGYGSFASVSGFPFEILGLLALLVFFVMAATSHDFWLANLSHRVWKSLHMLVYAAYGLIVLHVVFGVLQSETSPLYPVLLLSGAVAVLTLHVVAGVREWRRDAAGPDAARQWVDIGPVSDIEPGRARVVCLRGSERVAVFRHGRTLSAVSNVCAHQGGPLGEGRIVDGCITCPWHGYQYRPESGTSPPPYTEKIPTYQLRIVDDRVQLNPSANPPGTPVEPAVVPTDAPADAPEQTDG